MKSCSFFVSNSHLLTIILPYIDEKINEGKNVIILSQKNLNEDLKKYVKCVRKFDKEKIQKLFLRENNIISEKSAVVINIGNEDFINNLKNQECQERIDCYELEEISNIKEKMIDYEYYLRTDGLKRINNSQKEQNSNTIKSQL